MSCNQPALLPASAVARFQLSTYITGYHPDHWLDVTPLCRQCHADRHKIYRLQQGLTLQWVQRDFEQFSETVCAWAKPGAGTPVTGQTAKGAIFKVLPEAN